MWLLSGRSALSSDLLCQEDELSQLNESVSFSFRISIDISNRASVHLSTTNSNCSMVMRATTLTTKMARATTMMMKKGSMEQSRSQRYGHTLQIQVNQVQSSSHLSLPQRIVVPVLSFMHREQRGAGAANHLALSTHRFSFI